MWKNIQDDRELGPPASQPPGSDFCLHPDKEDCGCRQATEDFSKDTEEGALVAVLGVPSKDKGTRAELGGASRKVQSDYKHAMQR